MAASGLRRPGQALRVFTCLAYVLVVGIIFYYLGRPVYWSVVDHMSHVGEAPAESDTAAGGWHTKRIELGVHMGLDKKTFPTAADISRRSVTPGGTMRPVSRKDAAGDAGAKSAAADAAATAANAAAAAAAATAAIEKAKATAAAALAIEAAKDAARAAADAEIAAAKKKADDAAVAATAASATTKAKTDAATAKARAAAAAKAAAVAQAEADAAAAAAGEATVTAAATDAAAVTPAVEAVATLPAAEDVVLTSSVGDSTALGVPAAAGVGVSAEYKLTPLEPGLTTDGKPLGTASLLWQERRKSVLAKDHQLSPALVQSLLRSNMVLVTWANDHYWDFVQNWVGHLNAIGCTNYIVGAMDSKLLAKLVTADIPAFSMESGLTTGDFGWGTTTFHKMGREKIDLIRKFTEMGFDLLLSDVDTVWMRDPVPYILKYPDADVLTSSDHLADTKGGDGGLEDPRAAGSAANIGIMFFRATTKELAVEWVTRLQKDDKLWDQNAFNDLMRAGSFTREPLPSRVFYGWDGKVRFGILPVHLFCSGHTFFAQRMPAKFNTIPYVVHATFQYGGTEGKRHRFREAKQFLDPPAYYDPPGGLLVYAPDVPPELLAASVSLAGHFALVNHQLVQVRAGMALAVATGRTLVMPKIMCGFDRWWAPHTGTIPGSKTTLPMICPMDHLYDMEFMLRPQDEVMYGKAIDFREWTLLSNPRMSKAVNSSRLVITPCTAADAACLKTAAAKPAAKAKAISLAPGLTDKALAAALAPFKSVKILEFTRMGWGPDGAFGSFDDESAATRFYRRMTNSAAIWCCVNDHPGHTWYDNLWDMVPRPVPDRHGRARLDAWDFKIRGP